MNKGITWLAFSPIIVVSVCAAANPGVVPLSSLKLNGRARLLSGGYINLTRNSSEASSAFVPTPVALGPEDSFGAFLVYRSQQELVPASDLSPERLHHRRDVRLWVAYQNRTRIMKVFYSATPTTPLLETILPADLSTLFGRLISELRRVRGVVTASNS
jgi:hypothetical protein